jgi:hypothetical protein
VSALTPAARASAALREAADALDALPVLVRRCGRLTAGPIVVAQELRNEADYIDDVAKAITPAGEVAS